MPTTRKPKPKLMLGSVSSGTLRSADLIDAFDSELRYYGKRRLADKLQREFKEVFAHPSEGYEIAEGKEEEASYYVEALTEALEEIAHTSGMPFVYFGAHFGDWADFGFWIAYESIMEEVRDGNIKTYSDCLPSPIPRKSLKEEGVEYLLVVSDHGDETLYSLQGKELLSWE